MRHPNLHPSGIDRHTSALNVRRRGNRLGARFQSISSTHSWNLIVVVRNDVRTSRNNTSASFSRGSSTTFNRFFSLRGSSILDLWERKRKFVVFVFLDATLGTIAQMDHTAGLVVSHGPHACCLVCWRTCVLLMLFVHEGCASFPTPPPVSLHSVWFGTLALHCAY